MTFDQAMNKLNAGHAVNRTGWSNNHYLSFMPSIDNIYLCNPANVLNPTVPYNLTMTDFNATDWQVVA